MDFFNALILIASFVFTFMLGFLFGRDTTKKIRHQAYAPKVGKHKQTKELNPTHCTYDRYCKEPNYCTAFKCPDDSRN